MNPYYRTVITTPSAVAAGVKAVRFSIHQNGGDDVHIGSVHLYGKTTTGQNPNRLALWHPTLNQPVEAAYFDWGDAGQGTTADRPFRVKNLSATLSANSITCSTDALTDTSPTVLSQHTLSNGGSFASTASAGTLAAGAISGVLTLRRTLSSSAVMGLWALRVNAVATSWS